MPLSYANSRGDKSPWSSEGMQTGHPHLLLCVFCVSSVSPVVFMPLSKCLSSTLVSETHSIISGFSHSHNGLKMKYYVNLHQSDDTKRQEVKVGAEWKRDNGSLIGVWIGLEGKKRHA